MSPNVETSRFKNAKVFYRIFPMVKMHWDHVKILEDLKTLYVRYLQDFEIGREGVIPSYWKFETDGIFYNNTQQEIYEKVTSDVLDKVIEGNNAVILNFGQSGSGKSLTATGLHNCFKDRGIAPRIIEDLFRKKKALKKQQDLCILMSYIETKRMYVRDLLKVNSDANLQSLKGISFCKVKNEQSALKVLFKAEAQREFAHDSITTHGANGILTITVITRPANHTDPTKRCSKIHIVDLGGVDTYGNCTSFGKNVNQVGNANLAKSQLEQFVLILIQNRPDCITVKQRLNILIQYLGDSLNTHSILRCIGHIRIDLESLLITISMLRFGQCVRGLKPKKLQPNISKNDEIQVQLLEEKIKQMQIENDLNVMLGKSELSSNISQHRLQQMQHVAQEYLQDNTDELVVLNVTDANTVLKVFKDLYKTLEKEKVECYKNAYVNAYRDALMNVDNADVSSILRKKSKDSNNGTMRNKKSGQDTVSTKLSESKTLSKLKLQAKRSKTSSLILKKSNTSKRKSFSGSGTDVSPINQMEDEKLPKRVASYTEAWEMFVKDESCNYAALKEERVATEGLAKALQRTYLDAVNVLQKSFELVELRKHELHKAEMQRLFQKQTLADDAKAIPSAIETRCLVNLQEAQAELVQQQEKVLKHQTEFITALQHNQQVKRDIDEIFEDFCQKNYQLPVPNLDTASVLETVDEVSEMSAMAEEEPKLVVAIQEYDTSFYEKQQEIMKKQITKNIYLKKINKRWN